MCAHAYTHTLYTPDYLNTRFSFNSFIFKEWKPRKMH